VRGAGACSGNCNQCVSTASGNFCYLFLTCQSPGSTCSTDADCLAKLGGQPGDARCVQQANCGCGDSSACVF
jgi:hypothetical protein